MDYIFCLARNDRLRHKVHSRPDTSRCKQTFFFARKALVPTSERSRHPAKIPWRAIRVRPHFPINREK
jgi:hypothetical protein